MFMTNDSRKIVRFLNSKFPDRKEPDIDEIIAMEQSMLTYYPNPIINVMEGMMKKAKPEKLENYSNFLYHLPGLRRITTKRADNQHKLIGWVQFKDVIKSFELLLVVDYNLDVLLQLIEITQGVDNSKWNHMNIRKAILTSKCAGVYSVQYVMAILQREYAEKQAITKRANDIVNKAQPAQVEQDKASINFIERMSIEAMWDERKENSELEKKLRRRQ